MGRIRLNFLELSPQKFSFTVYRKPFQKDDLSDTIFRYRLPKDAEIDSEYFDFTVSFQPIPEFEKFPCNQSTNIYLSVRYLYDLFEKALDSSASKVKYYTKGRYSRRRIEFVSEERIQGEKLIVLSPYFLKSEGKFGYLINYRFKKKPDIPFNREIQKLSLSLDSKYRSNKNYYSDKYKIITRFIHSQLLPIIDSKKSEFPFTINSKMTGLKEERLDKKVYLFKDNKTDFSQFMGARNHGVYEKLNGLPIYAF